MKDADKFKNLLENSNKILISSHISPDPDALCSLLLLGATMHQNYPGKTIELVLEEEPEGLEFLPDYKNIQFTSVYQVLNSLQPDLFMMVDANNYDRLSRHDGQKIRDYIIERQVQVIIIDHHEPADADKVDLTFNQRSVAATLDVYSLLFTELKLDKPQGFATLALAGIYADTGGFIHLKNQHKKVFQIVEELLDSGINIEIIKNQLDHYTDDQIKVLAELAKNLNHQSDYNYSIIPDEFAHSWQNQQKNLISVSTACSHFVNNYIRNVDERTWGFVIYPNLLDGEGSYSASLRSIGGKPDVAKIAAELGGGGHKAAAGAKFKAENYGEALHKVQEAIAKKTGASNEN